MSGDLDVDQPGVGDLDVREVDAVEVGAAEVRLGEAGVAMVLHVGVCSSRRLDRPVPRPRNVGCDRWSTTRWSRRSSARRLPARCRRQWSPRRPPAGSATRSSRSPCTRCGRDGRTSACTISASTSSAATCGAVPQRSASPTPVSWCPPSPCSSRACSRRRTSRLARRAHGTCCWPRAPRRRSRASHETLAGADVAPIADRLAAAVVAADAAGRPLFAGLARQAWPDDPVGRLWRACELAREHRGDSHVAACIADGWAPIAMNVLTEVWVGMPLGSYSADPRLERGADRNDGSGTARRRTARRRPAVGRRSRPARRAGGHHRRHGAVDRRRPRRRRRRGDRPARRVVATVRRRRQLPTRPLQARRRLSDTARGENATTPSARRGQGC